MITRQGSLAKVLFPLPLKKLISDILQNYVDSYLLLNEKNTSIAACWDTYDELINDCERKSLWQ